MRLAHLLSERAPRTKLFPYNWHDSPNIHFLAAKDFEELEMAEGCTVERKILLSGHYLGGLLPNFTQAVAVLQVRK